jgi:hypothetical protein
MFIVNFLILYRMNKIITIFLILLFTVNEFSYITVYLPLKNLAFIMQKAKVEDCDNSNDYTLFVINESDKESTPVKYLNESEILFNGELYDVVNSVDKDGSTYIYCLKDETENLLDKSFKLHFDNRQNRKFSLNFFNLTVAKKLIAFVFDNYLDNSIPKIENVVIYYINPYLKPYIDKYTPPPRFS